MIAKKKGQLRFFYHYYKQYKAMTVHFKGQCFKVKNIECKVPCETKWNEKSQPNIIMQGFCSNVLIEGDIAIIS